MKLEELIKNPRALLLQRQARVDCEIAKANWKAHRCVEMASAAAHAIIEYVKSTDIDYGFFLDLTIVARDTKWELEVSENELKIAEFDFTVLFDGKPVQYDDDDLMLITEKTADCVQKALSAVLPTDVFQVESVNPGKISISFRDQ